jgi:hypothetical protein
MRSESGTVAIHVYVDDGVVDHRGEGRCRDCGLPKANRSHRLPARTDDERAAEARRIGENE